MVLDSFLQLIQQFIVQFATVQRKRFQIFLVCQSLNELDTSISSSNQIIMGEE